MSTITPVDVPLREKTSVRVTERADNVKSNGAPPMTVSATVSTSVSASADEPAKLTGLELKALKKAEKAAKRQQVIQNRQGGATPAATGPAAAILSPQGKGSPRAGKEHGGKGQHKRAPSVISSDSKNAPPRSQQQQYDIPDYVEDKTVELFRHLYKPRAKTIAGAKDVHPAVLSLGQQMSNYVVCGSNARLVATLRAFKRVCICAYLLYRISLMRRRLLIHTQLLLALHSLGI